MSADEVRLMLDVHKQIQYEMGAMRHAMMAVIVTKAVGTKMNILIGDHVFDVKYIGDQTELATRSPESESLMGRVKL